MTKVKPFRGVRPHDDLVSDLMLHQFDHVILEREKDITEEEIRERAELIGYSLEEEPQLEYFLKVGIGYRKLLAEGKLLQDPKPCYYLFGINWENHWLYGIVGAVHYSDYWEGKVKKHEDTIEANEAELVKITEAIDFNFNPIMLVHPDHEGLHKLIEKIALTKENYSYFNEANIEHKLWSIGNEQDLSLIEQHFESIPATYIADGHHRMESGSIVAKKRNEKGKSPMEAPHNYFIGIHFPASQIRLYEFNRLLRDLGPYTDEEFLEQLSHKFSIKKRKEESFRPKEKFLFGMYMNDQWYELNYQNVEFLSDDPVDNLDVSVIRKEIMTGILGITNFRSTDRISFVEGVAGINKLMYLVDKGEYKVAFTLCPANISEIFSIADLQESMPPKATCIEPKLKSGMISRLLS